jgi:hypothetical protein
MIGTSRIAEFDEEPPPVQRSHSPSPLIHLNVVMRKANLCLMFRACLIKVRGRRAGGREGRARGHPVLIE